MHRIARLFGTLALAVAASASAQVVSLKYVVTNLGNLRGVDGARVTANAINEAGQVVGESETVSGETHAFRTGPNRKIQPGDDLGTLGGPFSSAAGINNSGQVAGAADTAVIGAFGSPVRRAFRLDPGGTMIDLGTLAPNGGNVGSNESGALGINDAGQVVGFASVPFVCGSVSHGFRTAPNALITPPADDMGTLVPPPFVNCRSSTARAINNGGVTVGDSATNVSTGVPNHAFRTAPLVLRIDLGTFGGRDSVAFAINDLGETVGQAQLAPDGLGNSHTHAFMSMGSLVPRTIDLGTLGGSFSSAAGVNFRYPMDSQVVGQSTTAGTPALHAFVWTGNVFTGGTMVDLNSRIAGGSGWELIGARAINNRGQIVANAWRTGVPFVGYAVRLDPSDAAVQVLIGQLSDAQYALTQGQVNSLTDKLTSAYNSIQQGLLKQATNQLKAIVSQVQTAVNTGKMSSATGTALTAAVNAIIATLS